MPIEAERVSNPDDDTYEQPEGTSRVDITIDPDNNVVIQIKSSIDLLATVCDNLFTEEFVDVIVANVEAHVKELQQKENNA